MPANEGLYDSLKNLISFNHDWLGRVEGRVEYLEQRTRSALERHDTEDEVRFAKHDERLKKLELFNARTLVVFGAIQLLLVLGVQIFAKYMHWI